MKRSNENPEKPGRKLSYGLCAALIIITIVMNLYGYFNLPAKMATQISLTGEAVNRMPTPLYLILVTGLILIFSILYLKTKSKQKIKWLLADIIITISNIVMIAVQL